MVMLKHIFHRRWWSRYKLFLSLCIVGTLLIIIGHPIFTHDVDRQRNDFVEKHKIFFSKANRICSSLASEKFHLWPNIKSIDGYFRILSLRIKPLDNELAPPKIVWINNQRSNWSNEIALRAPSGSSLEFRKNSAVMPEFQITFPKSYVGEVAEFVISIGIEYPEYVEGTSTYVNKVESFDEKFKVYVAKGEDEEGLLNKYRSLQNIVFAERTGSILLGLLLIIAGISCWVIDIFIFLKYLSSFSLWKSFWVFVGCYLISFICILLIMSLILYFAGFEKIPSIKNHVIRLLLWAVCFIVPGLISLKLSYNYYITRRIFIRWIK
jgi:hypothetical protein